jgi:hypothetical protein
VTEPSNVESGAAPASGESGAAPASGEQDQTDLAGVKQDVGQVKTDLAGVKQDVGQVKTDLAGVKQDVGQVKTDLPGQVKQEVEKYLKESPIPSIVPVFVHETLVGVKDLHDRELNTIWSDDIVLTHAIPPAKILLSSKEGEEDIPNDYLASVAVVGYVWLSNRVAIYLKKVAQPRWTTNRGSIRICTVCYPLPIGPVESVAT